MGRTGVSDGPAEAEARGSLPPGRPEGPRPAPDPVPLVAMVNESRRRDGHQQMFEVYCRALAAVGLPFSVYQCVDPSRASEYATQGHRVLGYRVPGPVRFEVGVNRLLYVFPRRLAGLTERFVHVNNAFLAPLTRYRGEVVVTLVDLAPLTTPYFPPVTAWLRNRCLDRIQDARAVVCPTSYIRQEIVERLPVDPSRIHVVPLRSLLAGAPARPAPEPPTLQRPWTLLYVASDRPRKNLTLFFEILRRLDGRFRGRLVSRLRPATRDRISRMGLSSRLEVLDWVEDLGPVYDASHLLVHTAPYEGFGFPLAEAMSRALPVVAADHSSIPEVVGPGGVLVGSEDPTAWCRAVEQLTDPAAYSKVSQACRTWSDRCSLSDIGLRLRRAYGL